MDSRDRDSRTSTGTRMPVSAMILCGGRSRRMGRAKAFLPYEGTTVIAHIIDTVQSLFDEVLLVSNEPESYEDLGLDVVKDILPYRGPLGGILSGLLVAANDHVFVVACDMPLVDRNLMRRLVERRHESDVIIVSHDKGIEPLLGVYSKKCVKPLEESLFSGSLSIKDLLGELKTSTYQCDGSFDDDSNLPAFFNINTPQDYSRLITRGTTPSLHKFPERG